jgi:hypothetical protein
MVRDYGLSTSRPRIGVGPKEGVSPPFFEYFLNISSRCESDMFRDSRMMFSTLGGDTSDTVFVVNTGRWRLWEATDPKLRKCLKAA